MALLNAHFTGDADFSSFDPFPRLCAATDRLRRYASDDRRVLDVTGQRLLDEALEAAAEAEQSIVVQRARIRYLESLSNTDELTHLCNRRGFETEMTRVLARANRLDETGVLILCDLDHFKAINDTYGHPAGDKVLKAIAEFLRQETRETDVTGRLGGDEFALILTHTTIAQAKQRCHSLEQALNNLVVDWQGTTIGTSASFGLAPYCRGSQAASLYLLADQDLYRDKASGRGW